jgi:hypothetical protein
MLYGGAPSYTARASALATGLAYHRPPRGVAMPRAFSASNNGDLWPV